MARSATPLDSATIEHTTLLAQAARGRGQGRALMMALLDHARAQGRHVMVGAISGANPDAIALHTALGFDIVARMPQVGHKGGTGWICSCCKGFYLSRVSPNISMRNPI